MGYVIRGGKAYEYRSVRRDGRVTSVYVGGGISAESGESFRSQEAGQEIERQTKRAAWEAERVGLDEAERRSIESDAAYGELAEAAMLATGHHRPQRGRWRRRRPMATDHVPEPAEAGPVPITVAELAGMFARIDAAEGDEKRAVQGRAAEAIGHLLTFAKSGDERALPPLRLVLARKPEHFGKLGIGDFAVKARAIAAGGQKDVLIRDLFVREMEAMRDELAGPTPSLLERLLCERVALAWFDAHHRDIVEVEAEMGDGCSVVRAEYLARQRSRANARFLAAAKALATVRRLALPALQVNIEVPAPGPEPFNPATRAGMCSIPPRN